MTIDGKQIHIGCSENEEDAAKMVNWKCHQHGLPLKNPSLEIMDPKAEVMQKVLYSQSIVIFLVFQKQTRFVGVYNKRKKWQARLTIDGKTTYIGSSESEEDAAKMVNWVCYQQGIPLKNPSVGMLCKNPFFGCTSLQKLKKEVI